MSACLNCPAGKYSDTVGAGSSATCQSCGAGKYSLPVFAGPGSSCSGACPCDVSEGASGGTLTDGSGEYGNDVQCTWTIAAPVGDIAIQFTSFNTESGYDTVTIYACALSDCSDAVKLEELSGAGVSLNLRYTTSLGYMQVVFDTDGSVTREGFEATWSVSHGISQESDCV